MITLLAATVTENSSKILVWSGILLALLIVLSLGVWYYRRRWLSPDDLPSSAWTLDDIRRLRDEGALTSEEYQALRAAMIGAIHPGRSTADTTQPATPPAAGCSDAPDDDFDVEKGSRP